MKRTFFIILAILTSQFALVAQPKNSSEEILLTVGNEKVSRIEFEQIYLKNNQMVSETDRKSLEQYLDLFIIYKLKVAEAKVQGLQNSSDFQRELAGYRKQLVKPHLADNQTEERLLREAYERMKLEVNASHILIAVPETATPEDTTLIYNKAINIRNRIIGGENFESVARATSDDPSVKSNGGNLGYFSVFQMVYPFESAAFNTKIGEISMPIRTRFGYHIVMAHDKRPSQGQVKTAHIMAAAPVNASAEQKNMAKQHIDSVYKLVLTNANFGELATKYSQDPGSARNGGELPWFGLKQMPHEFEIAAFALKPGEVSKPIQTQFGWHIIKLLEKKNVGTFEEMLPEIKTRMARDDRGRVSRNAFINQLKRKYNFELDSNAIRSMELLLDSTIYTGSWELPKSHQKRFAFGFAGEIHTMEELASRIVQNKRQYINLPFPVIVERAFNELVNETIVTYEENRLISENPEIRYLLKEYHDGILLFEIMDQNVWSRSTHDSEGLETFFAENIQNYSWEKRIYVKQFNSSNQKALKKAQKLIASKRGANLNDKELLKRFISKGDTLIAIENVAVLPSNDIVKDHESWANGISGISKTNDGFEFYRYIKTVENDPKSLDDIRGQVISDFQEFLEKQWVEELKGKHPVKINNDVLQKIISNLN